MEHALALKEMEQALGHSFSDPALLMAAVTHRSFRNERPRLAPDDNERLEFLGDALLGATTASMLMRAFPDAKEGELTRRRAEVVCEAGLAEVAREIQLGPCLRLGKGEETSGGREKPRLLCSALEALVGAVALDAGTPVAFSVVEALLDDRILNASAKRDAKSRLQERVQAERGTTPRYRLVESTGPDHAREFRVEVRIDGEAWSEGVGRSKAEAEHAAAEHALAREPEKPPAEPTE